LAQSINHSATVGFKELKPAVAFFAFRPGRVLE
jgi:hypothetical protein